MDIVHKSGGYVFQIIYLLTKKCPRFTIWKMLALHYILSDTPVFDHLFTFYNMTHCFKNIRNNWVTEPPQTLEFVDPISKITYQTKRKALITIYNYLQRF